MIKIIVLIIVMIMYQGLAYADWLVSFSWTANTEPDMASYRLYLCASNPCQKDGATLWTTIAHPMTSVRNLSVHQDGHAALTAVDTSDNESGFSNTVSFSRGNDVMPPHNPTGLRILPQEIP